MKKCSAILAAVGVLAIGVSVASAKGAKAKMCREQHPEAVTVWKDCFKSNLSAMIKGKSPDDKTKVKATNEWKSAYASCTLKFRVACCVAGGGVQEDCQKKIEAKMAAKAARKAAGAN